MEEHTMTAKIEGDVVQSDTIDPQTLENCGENIKTMAKLGIMSIDTDDMATLLVSEEEALRRLDRHLDMEERMGKLSFGIRMSIKHCTIDSDIIDAEYLPETNTLIGYGIDYSDVRAAIELGQELRHLNTSSTRFYLIDCIE